MVEGTSIMVEEATVMVMVEGTTVIVKPGTSGEWSGGDLGL